MKKAFTLQELLITVGIVGVVAAVSVPTFTNLMPDKNKTMYFRALNALTTATKDMLNDDSLYWVEEYNTDGTPACTGLECNNTDVDSEGNAVSFKDLWENNPEIHKAITLAFSDINSSEDSSGTKWLQEGSFYKYPLILMSKLSVQDAEAPANCVSEFTTADGIQWQVKVPPGNACKLSTNTSSGRRRASQATGATINNTIITINVDSKAKLPKSTLSDDKYNFTNSLEKGADNPTVFRFIVENDGNIVIDDALGKVYMQTSTDFHRKKQDIEDAKKLLSGGGSYGADGGNTTGF